MTIDMPGGVQSLLPGRRIADFACSGASGPQPPLAVTVSAPCGTVVAMVTGSLGERIAAYRHRRGLS